MMRCCRRHRQQAGFTLIELMVVVSLAALMLTLGVPAMRDLMNGQRVKSAALAFHSAVLQARSEAIKRNAAVTLQASADGWANGWTVQQGATVLQVQDGFAGVVVASVAPAVTATQVLYQPDGRLAAVVADLQFGDAAGGHLRCMSFDLTGQPRSRMGGC